MAQEATYKWVQDRLRELHAGNISVDDRQQLEQLAQEDPFIADALEGFESHPHYPHLRTLHDLTTRIRPVKRERRRWLIPNLTVTAVAASIILIIGFWAVMSRIHKDDDLAAVATSHEVILNDSLAFTSPAVDDRDEISSESLSTPETSTTADAVEKQSTRTTAQKPGARPGATTESVAKQPEKTVDDIAAAREETEVAPSSAATVLSESEPPQEVAIVQDDAKKEAHDPMYFANQMDPGIMARRAAGRVISESGTPLIGANLSIRNTNLGTASDLDGKFELFLPAPESTVDISFSGYEGTSVKLKQGEEDVAILLPEVKIDRAYIKSQQAETAGRNAPGAGVMNVSTANQQIAYTDYLRNNSRYPLKDNLYTPGRDVTVKFDVTANGEPSRVRIATSSKDRELDEEAMRLIRKGPLWVCDGDQYPCEITYTIYFR